ncbi:hypothetical protein SLA2020_267000 [Shorea laevis]
MSFTKAAFWIQVHDIPLVCISKVVRYSIGSSLGPIVAIEASGGGLGWQKSLRIKVEIELSKPLERGHALQFRGKSHWASFRYEKLSRFCFSCSKIKHGPEVCSVSSNTEVQEKPYGVWLRADSLKRPIGGFAERGSTGVAAPGRPQAGAAGAGLHRPGFGKSGIHGENLSTVANVTAINPPSFWGNNQSDPPEDIAAGAVTNPAPRMETELCVSQGAANGRDTRPCIKNVAVRRFDPKNHIGMGAAILECPPSLKGAEVSVSHPSNKKEGQMALGEALEGNLYGLTLEKSWKAIWVGCVGRLLGQLKREQFQN